MKIDHDAEITTVFMERLVTVRTTALVCPLCGYITLPARDAAAYGKKLLDEYKKALAAGA